KHKKLVAQKVHLENGLFRGHGLYRKALAADDFEVLLCLILGRGICRYGLTLQSSLSQPLAETGLVPADLALDGGHAGVHGSVHVVSKFARPVEHSVIPNGYFLQEASPFNAESDVGVRLIFEELVQL